MFKKIFVGKYVGILSMLLMAVCVSMFAASKDGEWTVNPSDFRYDMSFYFSVDPEEYSDLEKYEIGAFIGDDCRGIARAMELPDGGDCLYMRVRSNNPSGQTIDFYVRDRESGQTFPLKDETGSSFIFNANDMIGMPSAPQMLMIPVYNVSVEAGEHGSVNAENGSYRWGSVLEIEATAEEGYAFSSWSDGLTDNPRQLTVESDVTLTANFAVCSYSLSLEIDGELYEMKTINYGDAIELPSAPEREGYTFTGWGEVPETMPAHDVTLQGSYEVNIYKLKLMLDGEVYMEYDTAFGTPLNREDFDGSTPAEREGYTFAGWGEVPETMPARDLELVGTFTPNTYLLTLVLNGEVYEILTVAYGETLNLPTPPEQEGLTWDGWDNAPETMPAHDLELYGDYEFNGYKLTLMLDGELYEMKTILYGDPIELPEMPEREGYTFSGWGDVPAKMPARDLEISGQYTLNSYKLTLIIDGEVYKEEEIPYGTELVVAQPEEKEGYTFSGWGEVLKTMPAHDVEFSGSYMVNTYMLTLMLDDAVYEVLTLEYGQKIEVSDAPEREGYTFAGWRNLPETMPADNITITGVYNINFYKLTFYIDGEVYSESILPYGHTIELPDPVAPDGYEFQGWEGDIPVVMPAYDLEIHGAFGLSVGIAAVYGGVQETFCVTTIDGKLLHTGEAIELQELNLAPGIYIINGKKVMVR
ncbi:MAG: InlB B-repeat-containing protein [Bacteroides sp.]|nr:InlB B-repeat-containing protein [Bacteroides sp.]